LTEKDGFLGVDLIWYKINEAIPEVDYRYSRIFNSKTIEKDLERGLLPIVNARYHKTENSLSADCEGKRRGVYYLLPTG